MLLNCFELNVSVDRIIEEKFRSAIIAGKNNPHFVENVSERCTIYFR